MPVIRLVAVRVDIIKKASLLPTTGRSSRSSEENLYTGTPYCQLRSRAANSVLVASNAHCQAQISRVDFTVHYYTETWVYRK
jgi:hypothetical protein